MDHGFHQLRILLDVVNVVSSNNWLTSLNDYSLLERNRILPRQEAI